MNTYNLQDQQKLIAKAGRQPLFRLHSLVLREQMQIQNLAGHRLTEGFALYGDELFHKSSSDLKQDIMEELADAFNYECVLHLRYQEIIR